MGRLRGYGNAIVAPVAEAFVRAYLDLAGLPAGAEKTIAALRGEKGEL